MSIQLYPSIAKIKRNGVYENLPGFVPETGSVATQQMIATAESSAIAQYVHNKGEYFRLNDTLYQAIVKINVGDAIVVGTNCEVAVIGNDLTHVANSIAAYELGIATSSHNTGDYFMVNETMYVATADIQVGDTISTSTNCRLAVVGDELSGLKTEMNDISEVGKNLFDKDHANVIVAVPDTTNRIYKASTHAKSVWIECQANTTYTISKMLTSRFIIAYGSVLPQVGSAIEGGTSNPAKTALTVTTSATAKYLGVCVWYDTNDAPITFEQVLATLQIEVGSTATQYQRFKYTAVDDVARSDIEEIEDVLDGYESQIVVNNSNKNATFGEEMIESLADFTAIGTASYADSKWTIPNDSGIETSLSVEADETYIIALTVESATSTDGSGNNKVNPLTITLGDDDISIFANPDANWKVCLTPTTTGSVTFSLETELALSLVVTGVSVKQVLSYPDAPVIVNGRKLFTTDTSGYSMAFGGGQEKRAGGTMNVAVGYNAQKDLDTAYANTAFGHTAQSSIRNGRGNCAFGHRAQEVMTTGMYNNAFGTVAQGALTSGCWNNAFGNEAQRDITTGCNNVSVGRRAHSYITTGNNNTAVGTQAGFATRNKQDGSWATTTASYQTLVGCEAAQNSADQSDYLTAVGYRAIGEEKSIAIGAMAEANGEEAIAIGYGAVASNDNELVIGNANTATVIIGGKTISFNNDGSVTWS